MESILCLEMLLALVLVAAAILAYYMTGEDEIPDVHTKCILVTGCDTGFGHDFALKCAAKGITVFAGCLTEKGMDNIAEKASRMHGDLIAIPLNVTDNASVRRAEELVREKLQNRKLWGLVNNAGILGSIAPDDWLTVNDYSRALDVNCLGTIRVTQAFLPLIKKGGVGRITITTSIISRIALPLIGPYSVSKHAAEAYADVIRREMIDFGISVHIIQPGHFNTAITNNQLVMNQIAATWEALPDTIKQDYGTQYFDYLSTKGPFPGKVPAVLLDDTRSVTQPVVEAYYHSMTSRRPRIRYVVGADAKLGAVILKFTTAWTQDMAMYYFKKLCNFPKPAAAITLKD